MAKVFLIEAQSFAEAQIIKNILISHHLKPFFRDENTRSIAPHYEHLLGKIIIEVPEDEFIQASKIIEQMQDRNLRNEKTSDNEVDLQTNDYAKKSLQMSMIGLFLPLFGSLYSTILVFRALKHVRVLKKQEFYNVFFSMMINIFAFSFWLILIHRWFRS